jgi:predicted ATP-dependent endonuclease of OLD family
MGLRIKLEKDYYGEGFELFSKKSVTIKEGLTILVGCNGIGKSTLLHIIKNFCSNNEIPCFMYDNLFEGGTNSKSEMLFEGSFNFLANSIMSSEGEGIVININRKLNKISSFIAKNKDKEKIVILLDKSQNKEIYIISSANEFELACGEQCLDVFNCKYRKFNSYSKFKNFILETSKIKMKREYKIDNTNDKKDDRNNLDFKRER